MGWPVMYLLFSCHPSITHSPPSSLFMTLSTLSLPSSDLLFIICPSLHLSTQPGSHFSPEAFLSCFQSRCVSREPSQLTQYLALHCSRWILKSPRILTSTQPGRGNRNIKPSACASLSHRSFHSQVLDLGEAWMGWAGNSTNVRGPGPLLRTCCGYCHVPGYVCPDCELHGRRSGSVCPPIIARLHITFK